MFVWSFWIGLIVALIGLSRSEVSRAGSGTEPGAARARG
jgi:hypothetical protein